MIPTFNIECSVNAFLRRTFDPSTSGSRVCDNASMVTAAPFWQTKSLDEMSPEEWESVCDGCGRCCLHKLRDEETDELSFTNVACRLLDLGTCQCSHYVDRRDYVPDCVSLTPAMVREIDWLPPSCAYRMLAEGRDLPPWHHLRSGDPATVHAVGASVRGRSIDEREAGTLEDYIVTWPGRMPRRNKGNK